jgi:ubiquinone/menaquinone biosynthesis C-methylase UbiE
MKARESGMPEEKMWQQFFNIDKILDELEINNKVTNLVEFGFGYGTFTIPAGKLINGNLFAFDIEDSLIKEIKSRLEEMELKNVKVIKKDFITEGTGLRNEEADYVMLFNILHAEESTELLKEAYRILKKGGKIGVIHWRYDPTTPRGPSMEIRPRPEDLKGILLKTGFSISKFNINLPPYHYGILAVK